MRHGVSGNRLSRNRSLFKATIRDLAKATLTHQRIKTTSAKAKQARKMVEKLITMGKSGTLADKRRAYAVLCDHNVVSNLFNQTAPLFKNRQGGYTRIIQLSTTRRGDNAKVVFLELTEKSKVVVTEKKVSAGKKNQPIDVEANAHSHEHKHEHKSEVKEASKEKLPSKAEGPIHKQEKGNQGKNIVGGIRKMFNRKTGGGG